MPSTRTNLDLPLISGIHPEKRKVFAMIRVSTKQQDMEQQQANIDFYCLPENFNLEVVETFLFPGTGGDVVTKTAEFKRMLQALVNGPDVVGVVFSQLDRMMRPDDIDDYGKLKIFRTGNKLMFCDADHGLSVTNPEDRAFIMAQFEQAAAERRKIRFRTHRAKERLIMDPETSITKLPRGVTHIKLTESYGPRTKKGMFEYSAYAYEKVKPAFERVAAGESINSVAKKLGFASETSLRVVLSNKWWIGIKERTHKRTVTRNEETGKKKLSKRVPHENPIVHHTNLAQAPLVAVAVFNRVQDLCALHRRSWSQGHSNTNKFLGTNFLYCQCGCKLYLKNDTKRANQPPTYVCTSYRTAKGPCGAGRLRAGLTDKQIEFAALMYFTDEPFLAHAIEAGNRSDDLRERRVEAEAARQRLTESQKVFRQAQKMVLAADEDNQEVMVAFAKAQRDVSDAKRRLAMAEAQAAPFEANTKSIAKTIAARYIMFSTFSMEEKRQTLRETVERIMIDRNGLATFQVRGGYPVHTPEFAGTPQALEEMESLRVIAQSYKDDLEHAKLRNLS